MNDKLFLKKRAQSPASAAPHAITEAGSNILPVGSFYELGIQEVWQKNGLQIWSSKSFALVALSINLGNQFSFEFTSHIVDPFSCSELFYCVAKSLDYQVVTIIRS